MPRNIVFLNKSRSKVIDLVCTISLVMALTSAWIGNDSMPFTWSMVGLATLFASALIFKFNGRNSILRFFVPFATTAFIIYMCIAFGAALETQNYLIIALVALAIYVKNRKGKLISIMLLMLVSLGIYAYQRTHQPIFELPRAVHFLADLNVVSPMIIVAAMCIKLTNATNKSYRIIWKQKNDLRKSNQLKDQVLSILGHDMRAPFNSAKSILSFLEKEELSLNERKTIISQLKNDIDLSVQTLENILEWASQAYYTSVSGRKTKIEKFDIAAMINDVIMAFDHLSTKKNIKLESKCSSPTYVLADHQQMAFVLRNLTSNALKFSFPNAKVVFDLEAESDMLVVSVKDLGKGMNNHTVSNLFRVDSRTSFLGTANEKGSGLGLILCKEFIENNKGKIWVESELDSGTTVYFTVASYQKTA